MVSKRVKTLAVSPIITAAAAATATSVRDAAVPAMSYSCPTFPIEGTEKLKPTIKLKVDDGEIAVLPFIIYLF